MLDTHVDLTRLDCLIDDLQRANPDKRDLLIEHLKSARNYLLGEMPVEYAVSLDLASDAAESTADSTLRSEVKETIDSLRSRKT